MGRRSLLQWLRLLFRTEPTIRRCLRPKRHVRSGDRTTRSNRLELTPRTSAFNLLSQSNPLPVLDSTISSPPKTAVWPSPPLLLSLFLHPHQDIQMDTHTSFLVSTSGKLFSKSLTSSLCGMGAPRPPPSKSSSPPPSKSPSPLEANSAASSPRAARSRARKSSVEASPLAVGGWGAGAEASESGLVSRGVEG